MSKSKKPVNPSAENALERMKLEVANELGISDQVRSQGWSTMTSADCGRVGGHMVRKMVEQYEADASGNANNSVKTSGTMTAQYDANNKP